MKNGNTIARLQEQHIFTVRLLC